MWDTVYVDYQAVFEKYPEKLFDATDKSLYLKMQTSLPSQKKFWPVEVVLWQTTWDLCLVLHDELVGMASGDTKTVTLDPKDCFGTQYDKENIKKELLLKYKNANISLEKWQIVKKDGKYVKVQWFEWKNKNEKVIFDMNALETYQPLIYTLNVVQVWWDFSDLEEEK